MKSRHATSMYEVATHFMVAHGQQMAPPSLFAKKKNITLLNVKM
jgi:hypothetical protein